MTGSTAVLAVVASEAPDPESVSPGLWGFLVVFVLAIVVWLLMRNMTGRLRRLRFREEERQRREAAERDSSKRDSSKRDDDEPPAPGPGH
jgi:flagellar biosynthesis/type III secretory pathway M-ring protein FliF/YscJ